MNNIIYGIILYVIIIATLVFTKPGFIYDYNKNKYKEFGTDENKTVFTLPIISIFLAIFIAICFSMFLSRKEKVDNAEKNTNVSQQNIQYIPVPYYPQNLVYDPRIIQGMSNISLSSSLSPSLTSNTTPIQML